jgi:hypothetical protein
MGLAVLKATAPFTLHIRCDNCLRESRRVIEIPLADEVPRDAEELIESAFLCVSAWNIDPSGGVTGVQF